MLTEYTAQAVATEVLEHLERRRPALVASGEGEALVRKEIETVMEPIRRSYADLEMPGSYLEALEEEVKAVMPARWTAVAGPFTRLEQAQFRLWRGGDVVARLTYVAAGLLLGGLTVAAPFIPIWGDWFPFAMAIGAWWLPDLQVRWLKRRYARALGDIVLELARAQPALDRHITVGDLLGAGEPAREVKALAPAQAQERKKERT